MQVRTSYYLHRKVLKGMARKEWLLNHSQSG